jgi:hypothetical protein
MAVRCPTCFKVNPASAAYCYYDGRPLGQVAPVAALSPGSRPLPRPFTFPNGQAAATFNQLVLTCDCRWNEARNNLRSGAWESWFGSIGRPDLAALARQSAGEADPDVGLCRLLEGLPADAEALRPAKLAVISTTENLGELVPGRDFGFKCVIENQGVLLLRGWATTDCDWLVFTDGKANTSRKLFQTRDTHTLWVRVVAKKIRAGARPLEGQIVLDTNGGCQTVAVRATVPVRPFPEVPGVGAVLAGAMSPREVAVKARAHAREAAALFEQGAVKAWYESNGWTYPVRGSQARGKGAVQQFYEALGLVKPPRLEINTQRINCGGKPGQRLVANVVVSTAETKYVNVEAHSSQRWVKVLPAKSEGKSVTVPLAIEVQRRPGETLQAAVTFRGNGRQEFVVPVTLTVAGITPEQAEKKELRKEQRKERREWALAGAVLFVFLAIVGPIAFQLVRSINTPTPGMQSSSEPTVGRNDPGHGPGPDSDPVPGAVAPPAAWWDKFPESHLAASCSGLKDKAGTNGQVVDALNALAVPEGSHRDNGYKELAKRLPELARNPTAREALGQFVVGCCAYEPEDISIRELLHGLALQFPHEGAPFPPEDKGRELDLVKFWLHVACDVITHPTVTPNPKRLEVVTGELNKVLGYVLDSEGPADEIKQKLEKTVVEQCYNSMALTVEKSPGQALAIREALIAEFKDWPTREFRAREDVKLLEKVLGARGRKGEDVWKKLEPIVRDCVESGNGDAGIRVIRLYEKTEPQEEVSRFEAALSFNGNWKKILDDTTLDQAAKAKRLHKRILAQSKEGQELRADRQKKLQGVLANALAPAGQPEAGPLQDSLRLARASTLASILLGEDAEPTQFDEVLAQVPNAQPEKPAEKEKPPEKKPGADAEEELIDPSTSNQPIERKGKLNDTCKTTEPRWKNYSRRYPIKLKAGGMYEISMESTDFTPYIRLEYGTYKAGEDQGRGAHFSCMVPRSGEYTLVVSATGSNTDEETKVTGSYTLKIIHRQHQTFFGLGMAPEEPGADELKALPVNPNDVKELRNPASDVRAHAFKNLAGSLRNNLPPSFAKDIAQYLLLQDWAEEADEVKPELSKVAKCQPLLQELDNIIANPNNPDKATQKRTEAVLEGLFGPPQHFPQEDWRSMARKVLLGRMLKLTERRKPAAARDADRAAALLCDLYKQQGLAFGMESAALEGRIKLTEVLESLIGHVAARIAVASAPADKDYPNRIGRRLLAARFVAAGNDLEYAVMLQRLWVEVLVQALRQGPAPQEVKEKMKQVPDDLDKKDRQLGTLLDQLRLGEEMTLRVWALALGPKPK